VSSPSGVWGRVPVKVEFGIIGHGLGPYGFRSPTINCIKFGLFILRKIIKIAAIKCHILRQKYTKFDVFLP